MRLILKEIALWAASIVGAFITLSFLFTEPVDGLTGIGQLLLATVGFVILCAASCATRFGKKIINENNNG